MKDLSKRLISGLIGIVLLIIVITKGGYLLYLSVYLLSILGLREFYKALENIDIKPLYKLGYLGSTVILIDYLNNNKFLDIIIVLLVVLCLLSIVFNKEVSLQDISLTLLGIFYIPFMLFHIMYLDKSNFIWLIFIIAFSTDTFAYIAGNIFGKRKLCPKVSPNKTVEGSIGGILGCLILVVCFSLYFKIEPIWKMIILSIISSIIAQLGDLTASKIKRITGIKDYGFIMPGHGGVLDRFDSIIFTTPIIYYYISNFII